MSKSHNFKLVILGDASVGKSCIVVRFVRDEFFEFQGKFWSVYILFFVCLFIFFRLYNV